MLVEVDYKRIQKILNDHNPVQPVTEAEAFHNVVGFINLLVQINDHVGLVPPSSKNS